VGGSENPNLGERHAVETCPTSLIEEFVAMAPCRGEDAETANMTFSILDTSSKPSIKLERCSPPRCGYDEQDLSVNHEKMPRSRSCGCVAEID